MIVIEFLIIAASMTAVILLLRNQILAQFNEYHFYKANGWDFSIDSGFDKLKLDKQIETFDLNMTNGQRFYIFRPLYILLFIVIFGFMVRALL